MVNPGRDVAADQRVQRPETREGARREQAEAVAGNPGKALDDRAPSVQPTGQDVRHGLTICSWPAFPRKPSSARM